MTINVTAAAAAAAANRAGDRPSGAAPALPKLPPMPGRRAGSAGVCACGCGGRTGGTWVSGHDGRATGWALRVERGVLALEEVPANERAGAEIMMARRRAAGKPAGVA